MRVWFWGGPVAGQQLELARLDEFVSVPVIPKLADGSGVHKVDTATYRRREWRGGLIEYEFVERV